MTRSLRALLALCLAGLTSAAHATEHVVLESNAERYAAGSLVDAASRIVLARGEFVVIVTEDARFIRVDGPHNGLAEGTTPDENILLRALTLLLAAEQSRVDGVGAVRSISVDAPGAERAVSALSAADTRPEPWLVHAERSGNQCILRGHQATFWREQAGDTPPWELAGAEGERTTPLVWREGERRTAWPAALAPQDGETYLIRPAMALQAATITIHVLDPSVEAHVLSAAAWLAAKGCSAQAELVLR